MFAQAPFEVVDQIVGYLDIKDVRSIARVCSAFRLLAQLQLFRVIELQADYNEPYPDRIESILSTPHLLQCVSQLYVRVYDDSAHQMQTFFHSLLPRLPMMYRLGSMEIDLHHDDCSRALFAVASLGPEKKIALSLACEPDPEFLISDSPLPVHSLEFHVGHYQVATRLIQKCSQSLHNLDISLPDNTTLPLPFLPHLCEFSVDSSRNDLDLMSWFPFLDQHPTITRISLYPFTLAVQPSPNLLPNLQFLRAPPQIIKRLIPGRLVNHVIATYNSQITDRFLDDIMLQPLRQPFVSVTTLVISTPGHFPNTIPNTFLINIDQALPKLRKFKMRWHCYEVRELS